MFSAVTPNKYQLISRHATKFFTYNIFALSHDNTAAAAVITIMVLPSYV